MSTAIKVFNAGRDTTARLAWQLPHDVRRSLYLRIRPGKGELYTTMRTKRIGEVEGLTVSLAPFEERRCIFVHVPKNGGTSVGRSLFPDYRGNHMPIRSYQMIYPRADFESFFKFGFVRNPFDRLLSAYGFARNGAERLDGASESTRVPRFSMAAQVAPYSEFEHFVTEWVTPANVRILEHFRPQHRFVCSPDGKVRLDHVGRFETLEADFASIADRVGVEVDLIHDRRTRGRDRGRGYADHYTPATRRIAERVFARDLRLFDYTFGG